MGKKNKDTVLECKNLCFSYKNHSDEFSLKSVELGLFPGRCLGVIGLNGQGKSTLCKVLSKAKMYGGGDVDFKACVDRLVARRLPVSAILAS